MKMMTPLKTRQNFRQHNRNHPFGLHQGVKFTLF